MIPAAHVVHRTSHRLRVKLPSKKGSVAFFSAVEDKLREHPDVKRVDVNAMTATALIVHDAGPDVLEKYVREQQLFRIVSPTPTPRSLFSQVSAVFAGWNRKLREVSEGQLDIPSVVFLALLSSAVYQIMRGRISAPAWYTALWYALGIFSKGQAEEWDEEEGFVEEGGVLESMVTDFQDAD